MKLKEIKLFKSTGGKTEELLESYYDFQLAPNVYNLQYTLTNITAETVVRINAVDADNKPTSRTFTIKVAP